MRWTWHNDMMKSLVGIMWIVLVLISGMYDECIPPTRSNSIDSMECLTWRFLFLERNVEYDQKYFPPNRDIWLSVIVNRLKSVSCLFRFLNFYCQIYRYSQIVTREISDYFSRNGRARTYPYINDLRSVERYRLSFYFHNVQSCVISRKSRTVSTTINKQCWNNRWEKLELCTARVYMKPFVRDK